MIANMKTELHKNGITYLMALPATVLLFLFNYLPLTGLLLPFKNYQLSEGILGSNWMKPIYYNFEYLFTSLSATRAIRNTLLLNLMFLVGAIIFEVGFAIMLNEMRSKVFKKTVQSFSFLPYFMSWIVVGVFSYNLMTGNNSAINGFLASIGVQKVNFYQTPGIWPAILLFVNRWKNTGYGAILYLATLTNIDVSYYEVAEIDGATRWQQIRYISLPMLRPTIIVLTLLALGRIFNADFGMFYSIVGDASTLYSTTDVIDTFVYRSLRITGDIGMSSAAGFVQSILSFIFILAFNGLVRKYEKDSAIF